MYANALSQSSAVTSTAMFASPAANPFITKLSGIGNRFTILSVNKSITQIEGR